MAADRKVMNDIEGSFRALLRTHPSARVALLREGGGPVPIPDSLVVDPAVVLFRGSALHLVAADEVAAVIDAWSEMLEVGTAYIEASFTQRPDEPVPSWFFDLRRDHGICAAVFVPIDPAMDLVMVNTVVPATLPPRVARMTKGPLATILSIDDQVTRMLGWDHDDLVGKRSVDFVHPGDHGVAIASWIDMLATPGHSYGTRQRHLHKDGHWVWVQAVNYNCLEQDGCIRTDIIDISEEMTALQALRDRERLLDRLAEALPVGVLQVDRHRNITYANSRLVQILHRDVLGEMLASDTLAVHHDDRDVFDAALQAGLVEGRAIDTEVRLLRGADRGERRVMLVVRPLIDDECESSGAIVTVDDVTESSLMRLQLEHRATFDPLTGCLNRVSILDALDRVLLHQAPGVGAAVVFMDLDGFKEINDGWGHAAGDQVLTALAARLRSATRPTDLAGRIGGDEFLVVCPGVANADEARMIADRISDAVSGPVGVPGGSICQQVSVGVAWTGVPVAADALIARADHAMYESKRINRGDPVAVRLD